MWIVVNSKIKLWLCGIERKLILRFHSMIFESRRGTYITTYLVRTKIMMIIGSPTYISPVIVVAYLSTSVVLFICKRLTCPTIIFLYAFWGMILRLPWSAGVSNTQKRLLLFRLTRIAWQRETFLINFSPTLELSVGKELTLCGDRVSYKNGHLAVGFLT